MKKIILGLSLLSASVFASEIFIKGIDKAFSTKDCTVVKISNIRTFVNCSNQKYVIKYKLDYQNKRERINSISLVDSNGKLIPIKMWGK